MVTDAERETAIRRAVEWLASPEGEKVMRESAERVKQTCAMFESRLTWAEWQELLHRPFTI